ncbi:hypothetical protein ACFO4L_08205 [Bacillus daqingensis]|uniref:Uncharacterized protein n=2 Tax=Bacillus daqingensis TaxID=872396 RepID=A0ABV9NYE4_9BACI
MQICKLMEYGNDNDSKLILAMANPDIPRIRDRVSKVESSLGKLGIIQFWVQKDGAINISAAKNKNKILKFLNLI